MITTSIEDDEYLAQGAEQKQEYYKLMESLKDQYDNFPITYLPESDRDFKVEYAFEGISEKDTSFRIIISDID